MENNIYQKDCFDFAKSLPDNYVDMIITSPPYWNLRDYGVSGQLGLENTFYEYIDNLCSLFDELKRVLKKEGTCWVNIGDTYAGNKKGNTNSNVSAELKGAFQQINKKAIITPKCLCQIPSRFAIEMANRGWILRNEIIWHKPNAMPSSAKDRFTVDFEKLFLFTKSTKYYFDTQREPHKEVSLNRIKSSWNGNLVEGHSLGSLKNGSMEKMCHPDGRNKRTVWSITTKSYKGAHFAVYPPDLIETPIKAGCPEEGLVLDPFMGAGTTAVVAKKLNRNFIGCEINPDYIKLAKERLM